MADIYQQNSWLLKTDVLEKPEKDIFNQILFRQADKTLYSISLKNLCEYFYRYYGEKTVVIMDEYDAAIHTGFQYDFYDNIIQLMKSLMGETFKDNSYLHKGVITGILRIAKEEYFFRF